MFLLCFVDKYEYLWVLIFWVGVVYVNDLVGGVFKIMKRGVFRRESCIEFGFVDRLIVIFNNLVYIVFIVSWYCMVWIGSSFIVCVNYDSGYFVNGYW